MLIHGFSLRSRSLLLVAGALLATVALLFAGADRAAAAGQKCSGTFRVLHNDTIGKLKLPKGKYQIRTLSNSLSCSSASKLFSEFLQDYDGVLPNGWRVRAKRSEFTNKRTGDGFRVRKAGSGGGGGGGGGGGRHPDGNACPNLFTVLHNDTIGKLKLPAGQYRITVFPSNKPNCDRAATLFRKFLQDYDGKLQNRWELDPKTATFQKTRTQGFRVKQVR